MENREISEAWRNSYPLNPISAGISDQRFDDFDAQSEQLDGHDQDYLQISKGAFSGRFASVLLGAKVSLHIESANQALEQRITCPKDIVTVSTVFGDRPVFTANGGLLDPGKLLITAPGAELNIKSPANGKVMAVCIDKSSLLQSCTDPVVQDYFDNDNRGIEIIDSPRLAEHLRGNVSTILEDLHLSISDQGIKRDSAAVGSALVNAIMAQFSLQFATAGLSNNPREMAGRKLFEQARRTIRGNIPNDLDYRLLSRELGCTPRSIQSAFARHTDMSPTDYVRVIKLNLARREILNRNNYSVSIGDIASRCGFWDWSRFSSQYKRQFGERPSDTRGRQS